MNTVTISIPARWEPAMLQIKRFVEEYARISGMQLSVTLTYELDPSQVYIVGGSLTSSERVVCQNAISEMSDYLNANLSRDAWHASSAINADLREQLDEIRRVIES
jgi:hypothetical protein